MPRSIRYFFCYYRSRMPRSIRYFFCYYRSRMPRSIRYFLYLYCLPFCIFYKLNINKRNIRGLSLWCLPPLSTIFQLQCISLQSAYWWRKLEYLGKKTQTCRKSLTNSTCSTYLLLQTFFHWQYLCRSDDSWLIHHAVCRQIVAQHHHLLVSFPLQSLTFKFRKFSQPPPPPPPLKIQRYIHKYFVLE